MEDATPSGGAPSDSSLDIPLAQLRAKQDELDEERAMVTVIDADQLREIERARDSYKRLQRKRRRYVFPPHSDAALDSYSHSCCVHRSSFVPNVDRRLVTSRGKAGRKVRRPPTSDVAKSLAALSDDNLVEIFKHLSQFPDLLRVRQVCRRWRQVAADDRLWKSINFVGHETVSGRQVDAVCQLTPALRHLRHLSLERVHGVNEIIVRAIPRAECAATIESVNLSWCSGASDKSVVEFSRCPRLRELRLAHCRLVSRKSIRILSVRCPQLEVLDIGCIAGVRDSLLSVLGKNCIYLRVLNIANAANVTDDGIVALSRGCTQMEKLDLSWCTRVTDWSIGKVARAMPKLTDISLSETKVTDNGLLELTTYCTKLRAIHLAKCSDVTNVGATNIVKNLRDTIEELTLASCSRISDDNIAYIVRNCFKLRWIDVCKLPCRDIDHLLEEIKNSNRNLEVYF